MWCCVERTGSSFACASAADRRVHRHWRAVARDLAGADRISGSRRLAGASAGRGQALATASDRVAIWHHSRRDVQPAEADRHHDPASADLRARQFRSGGHHRLNRQATARRWKCAAPVSESQSQGQARLSDLPDARTTATASAGCWRSSPRRKPMPRPRSRRTKPRRVSIPIRNTNSSQLRIERSRTPDVDLPYADIPPSNITPAAPSPGSVKDATRLYFGVDPLASAPEGVSPWAPGEAPVVLASRGDPDIKQSALHAVAADWSGHGRRKRREQRRGHRRGPAAAFAGRKARAHGCDRAPRRRSVSRTQCISKRAAKRCVGRSRSRRW